MQWKTLKLVPLLVTGAVLGLVCFCQALPLLLSRFDLFHRLEWMTYDWRVRLATRFSPVTATNLGFVFMDDDTVEQLSNGLLDGESYGLLWPRLIYGRLIRELSVQGAKAVAFDVLFGELRPDHPGIDIFNQPRMASDDFFAEQIRLSGNVILAAQNEVVPHELFRTNAWDIGDISNEADSDGISRRVRAFKDYHIWNPSFKSLARQNGLKLWLDPRRITFLEPVTGQTNSVLEIDSNGFFQVEDLTGTPPPQGFVHLARAYTRIRVWHMGIVLAARELNLNLGKTIVDLVRGRIRLLDADGIEKRVIPVDGHGRFLVDWSLKTTDEHFTRSNLERLLRQDIERIAGQTENLTNRWKDKLVVVGSAATGSNLTDLGATPLESKTFSAGTLWNAANSVITGRFITESSYQIELLLILGLGFISAVLSWKFAPPWPSVCVILSSIGYVLLSAFVYVKWRYWVPLVLPIGGALIMTHICSVGCQALMEQRERQRIKRIFTKIVSPEVVNELLDAEELSLGGAQRHVTVLFADVRGFTEIVDLNKAKIEEHIQRYRLTGRSAEVYADGAARETLATVNLYLATVADLVKLHQGTLDKYIGDCVMAFWGAPMLNVQHALFCVRAAIDAQRAVHELNQKRFFENKLREEENQRLLARGQAPLPMLSLLSLGTGINTGRVIVGLMGSDSHLLNYTLFGREVNLASRLEGISGHSRILIGESTFWEIEREDPELASTCLPQPAVLVKGIRDPVRSYEVPWRFNHSSSVLNLSSVSLDPSPPDTSRS